MPMNRKQTTYLSFNSIIHAKNFYRSYKYHLQIAVNFITALALSIHLYYDITVIKIESGE